MYSTATLLLNHDKTVQPYKYLTYLTVSAIIEFAHSPSAHRRFLLPNYPAFVL